MERKLCGDCRWKIRFLCIRTRFGVQANRARPCPTIQWHKKTNGVIVESRESMFFPTTSSMPHFESRELRCIWAPCKKVKRSYSGVGALSLASLMSQRTFVSACQLLSCLSVPPWATFAPQLNAAWITEMHRNAMSGGACFARYRRSMESQAGVGRILLHSKLSNRTFPSRICVDTWDSRPDIVSSCEHLLSSYNPYFLQDPGATARRVDDNLWRSGGWAGWAGWARRHNLESRDAMGAFDLVGECILQTATTRKAVATALTGVWFTMRDGIQRLISERNTWPQQPCTIFISLKCIEIQHYEVCGVAVSKVTSVQPQWFSFSFFEQSVSGRGKTSKWKCGSFDSAADGRPLGAVERNSTASSEEDLRSSIKSTFPPSSLSSFGTAGTSPLQWLEGRHLSRCRSQLVMEFVESSSRSKAVLHGPLTTSWAADRQYPGRSFGP